MVATALSLADFLEAHQVKLDHRDVYLSFLPLAHVFDRQSAALPLQPTARRSTFLSPVHLLCGSCACIAALSMHPCLSLHCCIAWLSFPCCTSPRQSCCLALACPECPCCCAALGAAPATPLDTHPTKPIPPPVGNTHGPRHTARTAAPAGLRRSCSCTWAAPSATGAETSRA